MSALRLPVQLILLFATAGLCAADEFTTDVVGLAVPQPGAHELRLLTPEILELALVSAKNPEPAKLQQWNFIDAAGTANLPKASDFEVTANGTRIRVEEVGFRRRTLYAPLKRWIYVSSPLSTCG
jgi:hypothetical protein